MAGKTACGSMARVGHLHRATCAMAAMLAVVATVATMAVSQNAAWADELGTGAEDNAFDLNLVLSVEPVDDPAHPLGTQYVDVQDEAGCKVAGALVSFAFEACVQDAPVAESTEAPDEAASSQPQAVLSGSAATDDEGRARLDNLPSWCSYAVTVESEGYERYEGALVRQDGGEPWRVVLSRPGASDVSGGPDVVARPLFPFGWLMQTGDGGLVAVLVLAGLALVGAALAVLARRKAKEGGDVR